MNALTTCFSGRKSRLRVAITLLGGSSALLPITSQAEFFKDSHAYVGFRNFYVNRDFKGGNLDQSRDGSWSQGFDWNFRSGYTEGVVGFGLDLSTQHAFRLDGGRGRTPDIVLPYDSKTGRPVRDYGRAGATAKIRYKQTELTIGEHRPTLPVVFHDDSRQLDSVFEGVQVKSKIGDFDWTAGRFTSFSGRNTAGHHKLYLFTRPYGPVYESDGLSFVGTTYKPSDRYNISYFHARMDDVYRQNYVGLTFVTPINEDFRLINDLRYFKFTNDGKQLYGKIDTRIYNAMTTLRHRGHGFSVGYQSNVGGQIPTIGDFTPQPYVANWSALGFIMPNEKSWQLRYTYDFTEQGLPGLNLMTRYIRGNSIKWKDQAKTTHESESGVFVSYTLQNGPMKGLMFEWRGIRTKVERGRSYDENRLITTYTWNFW